MIKREDITGIVLSGGRSSRMGSDKAMIEFEGKKLIEHSLAVMRKVAATIIISANSEQYADFGEKVVSDNYNGIGPLAGLEACLRISNTRVNLLAPCDTPLLNVDFLNTILENIDDYDAVVPISANGKIEPLTGYYSRDILPIVVQQIERGDFKVQNLLKRIRTNFLPFENRRILKNINTPDDLRNIDRPGEEGL
jgi:molybdopterin-guanine dinucleotide biosynthesis protein A